MTAPKASGACRQCGAPILWAVQEHNEKGVPLDPEPAPTGKFVVLGETSDGRLLARRIFDERTEVPEGKPRHHTHFDTCAERDALTGAAAR